MKNKKTGGSGSPFDVILQARYASKINGIDREVDVEQALQHRILQDALAGDIRAVRQVIMWILERLKIRAMHLPSEVTFLVQNQQPATADQALMILGIAKLVHNRTIKNNRPYLELVSQFVEIALRRPHAKHLTKKQLKIIREHVHNSDAIDWPAGVDE